MLRQIVSRHLVPRAGLVANRPSRIVPSLRVSSKRYFSEKKVEVGEVPLNAKVHKSAPPPPPPSSGGSGGMWVLLTAAIAGGGYYFKDEIYDALGWSEKKSTSTVNPDILEKPTPETLSTVKKEIAESEEKLAKAAQEEKKIALQKDAKSTSDQKLPEGPEVVKQTVNADWSAIRDEVVSLLDADYDDGSYGPVFVRLAWHSAGTYNAKNGKGGTEGAAMRFAPEMAWGANKGLDAARNRLEPIKAKHPEITYSDLWSFAGTVAIEEMGGPKMKWRPGRKDYKEGENVLEDGLLPDADGRSTPNEPAAHIREIFGRMGFNDQEAVALIGAHALGRCHTKNSGYEGPWTFAPTTFSNEFFRLLLEETWTPKNWKGPLQYEDSTKKLMMLPTDIALVKDEKFKKYSELYAKDEEKFFKDFANAWMKLQENGVKRFHGWRRYILFGPRE